MSEQNTDNKLYVVELENNKIFLHFSPPIYEDYLFQECIVFYDFVKNNRPIKVLKVIDLNDVLEIDYYVKYYMRHHGIDNVRGGSYTHEILNKNELEFLKRETYVTNKQYENDIDIFESILQNNQNNKITDETIEKLNKTWNTFSRKRKLISILYDEEKYEDIVDFYIFKTIIRDVEWLQGKIKEIHNDYNEYYENQNSEKPFGSIKKMPNLVNTDDKNQYKQVLERLHFLTKIYFLINQENLSDYLDPYLRNKIGGFKEYDTETFIYVYIQKPIFILDYFFLHPHLIINWERFIGIGEELLDEYSYMAYSINNLVDELKYDLSQYHPDFEKTIKYTQDYYELLKSITFDEDELEIMKQFELEDEIDRKMMDANIKEYYDNREMYDNFQKLHEIV
jgi:hypothetical protein